MVEADGLNMLMCSVHSKHFAWLCLLAQQQYSSQLPEGALLCTVMCMATQKSELVKPCN